MFSVFLRVVGVVQLVLGLAYLFMPGVLLQQMGHSSVSPDVYYPLGMLAARFIAYGLGLWIISRHAREHALWVALMGLIQLIDLGVGVFYSLSGVLPWRLSAFPMFNAVWIGAICSIWYLLQRRAGPGQR
ncbi:hypothetical protein [Delftia sp. PS-11]|uniref:hypothetical protein n=1 Tax=Delftia sp. PS-11 TaxID=2767222 RepID=UPI002458B68E|nr:hypothetical protein [Delftia sp. PS-11]KAJ8745237.1 hypothetical protein H9T68_07500 [Delftia sp. PS-11]